MTKAPVVDPSEVAAYSAFYRESVPRLVAFLRWQDAPLADAADCVQETMMLALPPKWATLENPHAWCRTTASRIYARRVANCREIPVANVESLRCPLIAENTDIDAFEQRHRVLPQLTRLPPRQRQVMAWTLDGATPTEIAHELHMDPQTVRSTLRDARKALRRLMDENGGYTT